MQDGTNANIDMVDTPPFAQTQSDGLNQVEDLYSYLYNDTEEPYICKQSKNNLNSLMGFST